MCCLLRSHPSFLEIETIGFFHYCVVEIRMSSVLGSSQLSSSFIPSNVPNYSLLDGSVNGKFYEELDPSNGAAMSVASSYSQNLEPWSLSRGTFCVVVVNESEQSPSSTLSERMSGDHILDRASQDESESGIMKAKSLSQRADPNDYSV